MARRGWAESAWRRDAISLKAVVFFIRNEASSSSRELGSGRTAGMVRPHEMPEPCGLEAVLACAYRSGSVSETRPGRWLTEVGQPHHTQGESDVGSPHIYRGPVLGKTC